MITKSITIIRVNADDDRVKIDEAAKYLFTAPNETLILLLSRLFGIRLDTETVRVVQISAEYILHNPGYARYYPDIVFEVQGLSDNRPLFHVEVQTEYDRMMDIRMVRYGYLIGAARSEVHDDAVRVITIPHQVVLYLEENSRISDEMTVRIVLPSGSELDYTVPVLKLFQYPVQELGETDLYLLLPLVLVKYRKRFEKRGRRKNKSQKEFEEIIRDLLADIEDITRISGYFEEMGKMDEQTKDIILSTTIGMYSQLHRRYIRDQSPQEKVECMIESVSQKIRQKWHTIGLEEGGVEGREEGKEQGIEEGIKTVAKNLIKIGTEDTVIIAVTGLSEEELEKIKADIP